MGKSVSSVLCWLFLALPCAAQEKVSAQFYTPTVVRIVAVSGVPVVLRYDGSPQVVRI